MFNLLKRVKTFSLFLPLLLNQTINVMTEYDKAFEAVKRRTREQFPHNFTKENTDSL